MPKYPNKGRRNLYKFPPPPEASFQSVSHASLRFALISFHFIKRSNYINNSNNQKGGHVNALIRKAGAAFGTATSQNLASVRSRHSLTEAVDFLTMELFGLIGTLCCHLETPPVKILAVLIKIENKI